MKNSFCRICRGRFNLKYPPAAVDSAIKKSNPPRTISVRIAESGEVSENICWDCEETLLGFHKSIGEDNEEEEEEPVVVDDDEILYKSLEKSKRIHRLSKETEIIQIDSSDSDPEELVIVPIEDTVINVEAARTNGGGGQQPQKLNGGVNKNNKPSKMVTPQKTLSRGLEDTIHRGKVFESKKCPLCPYHSGVECEVVLHIRQTHPQYIGDDLRFDTKTGDSVLTRRIIFAHLWTFFECKECGKIYDRFWPHRKHITTHDRIKIKNGLKMTNNINNKVSTTIIPISPPKQVKSLKRPLDEINDSNKSVSNDRVKLMKLTNNNNNNIKSNETNRTLVIKLHKSESKPTTVVDKLQSQSEKSKSNALLRKQQQLQARRDKRRQKKQEEKKAAQKAKNKSAPPKASLVSKPTFKMPTQPAPRASSVAKPPLVQKLSFTCKMCSKVYPNFLGWNSHMMRDHNRDEFKKQRDSLEGHICKSCDKHFNDEDILQNHMRFSHRRKNRKLDMEVNGNDKDEVCCQSQKFKIKETTVVDQVATEESLHPEVPVSSIGSDSTTSLDELSACFAATENALFCQYCGSLFPAKEIMATHESRHITDGDVKRYFVSKPNNRLSIN
ncbi:uncharacterized protein LOC129947042 [Eupeodes corollae]|uniref:uncharacterized protein LOC129947042 n=1 Tax=Eupeodes corollae TaxID=290404 RepID=UPI0024933ADE|nr:uncharacterized protein LOC129947042 [Eupeodes corollae]